MWRRLALGEPELSISRDAYRYRRCKNLHASVLGQSELSDSHGHRDASPAPWLARVSSAASPVARHPTSGTTRETHRASLRTPPATGPARSGIHAARSVRGSTTSHHAIGAGRCEARGCRWAYFSQPICGDDRSLCSPEPSPPVPRQRAQSANSLGKWHARQDSNLRPSA